MALIKELRLNVVKDSANSHFAPDIRPMLLDNNIVQFALFSPERTVDIRAEDLIALLYEFGVLET